MISFQDCRDNSISIVNAFDNIHTDNMLTIVPMRIGASWIYSNKFLAFYSDDPPDTALIATSIIIKSVIGYFDTLQSRWWIMRESSFVYSSDSLKLSRIFTYLEKVDNSTYKRLFFWGGGPMTMLETPITNGNSWDWGHIIHSDTTVTLASRRYEHTVVTHGLGFNIMIAHGYGIIYEKTFGDNLEYDERILISTNIKQ